MPDASITIEVGAYNGTPGFIIDKQTWEPNVFTAGEHILKFAYDYGETARFKMFGKSEHDTRIDNEQNIIEDKFILIKTMRIDYMEILNWQFHKHIWNPYFAYNNQERFLTIPTNDNLPLWYINLQDFE